MVSNKQRVTIRGTSDGLIVKLGAGDWNDLLKDLDQRLTERASFFKGGRVALQLGPRQVNQAELAGVGDLLDKHGVTLWAVAGQAPDTQTAAAGLGLETQIGAALPPPASTGAGYGQNALLVRRTLRSGQRIEHPGHVIVIGDVNPGGEIRAGGNIIIWGRLRGVVHAGLSEGEQAIVCALVLNPTQLRIGQIISRSPGDSTGKSMEPEIAFVQDGQIVAQAWK
jgi:septum site-determining protein MinC